MKGISKAFARTPHLLTTKVGMSKKSSDPEFDDFFRRFASVETATDKLIKDTKAYNEAVNNLFTYGAGFAEHFAILFRPLNGEYDLSGKHPEAEHTIQNVDAYEAALQELKASVVPELELIESRILAPVKELQSVLKVIRKTITKREHKLVDYDRYNNSLTKLRDKKEKSLNDEKHLFKLEQDFEVASNEYEYINTTLKTELPRFLVQCTQFIDPLFHSFFYMQLNIYYLMLEKLSGFADGKYDVSVSAASIAEEYESKRSDAWERVEGLGLTQRIVSTSKMMQEHRTSQGLNPSASLGRTGTGSSATSSLYGKKAPPPPPSAVQAPPPPYSPSSSSSAIGTIKKAPPPPPLKPKPKPGASYVVALYDFTPQAEGDLEFGAGDRIEVVERTDSVEDWWTGRIGDREGVFPGNYVQEA
ncbi:BAR-domain-containing protein [Laetiporus sulphureus 93-53]|uniref:BAR-domain-containing protein n=1 Tax=Laetiporus sulphureus 93-53 TaxID=1314785 RepID=A0A165FG24_9APHY|nr:BAR-domain-containing protein [Laetiporus sulphureus 93-53]KZT08919.1 BAR-domain-containing protein [Laetiporus sulphureus 93-53]